MRLSSRFVTFGFSLAILGLLVGYRQLGYIQSPLPQYGKLEDGSKRKSNMSKDEFIAAAMNAAIDDDYDYSHLKAMCDGQPWDNTVVFTCHGVIGGIGNVRQELLHCIRYAIDAGAGLIVPTINLRSEGELSNLEDGTAPLSYLFDQDRFLSRFKTGCPQMPIYKDLGELKKVGPVNETRGIEPKKLPHWPTFPAFSARARVKELKAPYGQISLIPFERVWQYFPICHDSVGFAETFGNLLPLRQDVHRLAATILYELLSDYYLPIDPTVASTLSQAKTFLGIHLRTASDILPYWLKYTDQTAYYLSHIKSSQFLTGLPIIYLASGNATSIRDFSVEAQSLAPPKSVVTKNDLLSGADLAELHNLTWDQQALVDYLVLSRSAFFMGMADSSFAWTIAVGRRRMSKAGSCGFRAGFWKSHLWGTVFKDEFSDIMGNRGYGWEAKMWP